MTDKKRQQTTHAARGTQMNPTGNEARKTVTFQCAFDEDQEARAILIDHATGKILQEVPFHAVPYAGRIREAVAHGVDRRKTDYVFAVGDEIVIDPKARVIRGREHFGSMEKRKKLQVRCSFPAEDFDWGEAERSPAIPEEQVVAYGLHVRGFTRHSSSKVPEKGTFTGLIRKIDYFKELGVNRLILMPCYEFEEIEERRAHVPAHARRPDEEAPVDRKLNYWGFTKSWYFAPKTGYCATDRPDTEYKTMVRSLHAAGIEVIMEFAFFDEVPEDLALEALRFWVREYHVDGFFLMCRPSIAYMAAHDALLAKSTLMTGYFDPAAAGLKEQGLQNDSLYNCNDGFKMDMRRFLKGDADMTGAFLERIRQGGLEIGYVNYLTAHDGFTMMDLVSYDRKHNEENGENGRDGAAHEYSWNCGVEGPSGKRQVRSLRLRQMKNAFAMLLLARGIPMILAGDELGNTQNGNNNPYCIDSPVTWVNHAGTKSAQEIHSFVRELIRFRKAHPILATKAAVEERTLLSCGYPAFSSHSERAWFGSDDDQAGHVGLMYCGVEGGQETFLYAAFNAHWNPQTFALPHLPQGLVWETVLDTGEPDPDGQTKVSHKAFTLPGRTVRVLCSVPEPEKKKEPEDGADPAELPYESGQ